MEDVIGGDAAYRVFEIYVTGMSVVQQSCSGLQLARAVENKYGLEESLSPIREPTGRIRSDI